MAFFMAVNPLRIFCKYAMQLEIKTLFNRIKSSAKQRNIPFTLTLSDLNDLTFPVTCPMLNIPLKFNRGRPQDDSYSIDRIDSSKGYHIDNIIVISYKANRLKSNATMQEATAIAKYINENHQILS